MVAVAAAAVIAVVELGRAVSSSWPLPARSEELQSASQAFFEPNETSYTPSAIVEYNNSKPSIMRDDTTPGQGNTENLPLGPA